MSESPTDGSRLSHLDAAGHVQMVDTTGKPDTLRLARARGLVSMPTDVRKAFFAGELPKGEGVAAARLAGIQAAKETSRLIPLCHPLALRSVKVDVNPVGESDVEIVTEVKCEGHTGVEMEALTAVSVAALTVYDMCKALSKGIRITDVELLHKSGGKSGTFDRGDT